MHTPTPHLSNALIALGIILVAGAVSFVSYTVGHEQGQAKGQIAGETIAHKAWVEKEALKDNTQRREVATAKALGELEGRCSMVQYAASKEICQMMLADIRRGK